MPKKIAAFGEILWDLLPTGRVLGGAPTNFIFRINSFGDKGILLSRVGNDRAGREACKILRALGVSDHNIQTDYEFPTGTVNVKIDENGIPDFTITPRVAYDHIEITSETIKAFCEADCVCFGTLIQRYGISKNTLRELIHESPDAIKFLDINLRKNCYTRQIVHDSLHMADIVKLNDDELLTVKMLLDIPGNNLREIVNNLLVQFRLKTVLCTLGDKGAFVMSDKQEYYYDPGYKVQIGDTIGAGDACSAGFIHYLLNGRTLEDALKFGNASGALVATTTGATTAISKQQIIDFMNSNCPRNYYEQK